MDAGEVGLAAEPALEGREGVGPVGPVEAGEELGLDLRVAPREACISITRSDTAPASRTTRTTRRR